MKLPQITLVALTGVGYKVEAHKEALERSQKDLEFGAVKLIQLPEVVDIDSWNKAIIYELPKYIETDFCILIHADGYIINPELWNPDWLNYDFCGSPFPLPTDNFSYRDVYGNIQRVGNSVSLRSKCLIDLAPKLKLEWKSYYGNTNEDGFITVHNRHIYEQHGMRFMPFEEAIYFGKEAPLPENEGIDTFLFHKYE